MLSMTIRARSGVLILDCVGEIGWDSDTAKDFAEKVRRLIYENGPIDLVVNLAGVTRVDSTGLGWLVSCWVLVRKAGGQLKLLNVSEAVKCLLSVTKLDGNFEIFGTEEEALASFYARR